MKFYLGVQQTQQIMMQLCIQDPEVPGCVTWWRGGKRGGGGKLEFPIKENTCTYIL